MSESTRPKRVVIVDAENPLQEIQGEFYWSEDRILAAERQVAFHRGYAEGFAAGQRQAPPRILVRYRRFRLGRLVFWALAVLVIVSYLIDLVGSFLQP